MKKMRHGLIGITMALVFLVSACGPQPVETVQPSPGGDVEETVAPPEEPVAGKNLLISSIPRESDPQLSPDDVQTVVAGNSAFAMDLYHYLIRDEQGNQFYSPYSISLALAMTYAGARGETERQMADTLHFNLSQTQLHPAFNALDQKLTEKSLTDEDSGFRLSIANSLWGQDGYPFREEFLDLLARHYGAGMYIVDYNQPDEVGDLINAWVAEQTEDKIQDLIPRGALTEDTRLVLANAIYFNAAWVYPFDPGATRPDDFTLLNGSVIQTPMMQLSENLSYLKSENYQVLELPYDSSRMTMLIFLPDEGEFATFDQILDAEILQESLSGMQMTQVDLSFPKFKVESKFSLNNALEELGMPDAFDPYLADFTGMTEVRELFITDVVHKAYVDVNEEGTEAAAATGVVVGVESMPAEQVDFKVDRPFVFMIMDRDSDTILFLGRVIDPR